MNRSEKPNGFIPWPDMLRAALRLGLSPFEFWRMSLKEWRWLSATSSGPTLPAARLTALMKAFPDAPHSNGPDEPTSY